MRILTAQSCGLKRAAPDVDVFRVQDTVHYRDADDVVLAFAVAESRILLTHDVNTMNKFAYDRVKAGLSMPGVLHVPAEMPLGQAIEELAIIVLASEASEWENQVNHLPLK